MFLTRFHRAGHFHTRLRVSPLPFLVDFTVSQPRCSSSCPHDAEQSKSENPPVKSRKSKKTTSKKLSDLPTSFFASIPPDNVLSLAHDHVPNVPSPLNEIKIEDTLAAVHEVTGKKSVLLLIEENFKSFPHCLILTRIGQFYESYFDQAVEISQLLNIKLTSRRWKGKRIAMCGFPIVQLDRYLKILVQKEERSVAMCEEFMSISNIGTKIFDRRVARIITPGTVIDESWLDPLDANYLLAIDVQTVGGPVGLAWIDVSTGEMFSTTCDFEEIENEIARIRPREVVLDQSLRHVSTHPILSILKRDNLVVSYTTQTEMTSQLFRQDSDMKSLLPQESEAVNLLSKFLRQNLLEHMPLLKEPSHKGLNKVMHIDSNTIRGLEIRETSQERSAKGSMFSIIKRTNTNGGARLLTRWLCSPSISIPEITSRQDCVEVFKSRPHFHRDMCEIMKQMVDVHRICQRFQLTKAGFADLISLQNAIATWETLQLRIVQEKSMESIENNTKKSSWESLDVLISRMENLQTLLQKISGAVELKPDLPEGASVDPDAQETVLAEAVEEDFQPSNKSEPSKAWRIKPNYSDELAALHAMRDDLIAQKDDLAQRLRTDYNAPSLTLRSTPGLGMIIHISKAKRDSYDIDHAISTFHRISESGSTKTYFYKSWADLGNSIDHAHTKISSKEYDIFASLCREIIASSEQLQENARVIDELDVVMSFATLANEMSFVRPEITDDGSCTIVNGRHPTVEMGLLASGRQFIPNSVDMSDSSNMHIITGPNMAGKSTLLRQTALIVILAQIGSFVPADSARIGVVDKLLSRIGASDNLFRDRSTFMVEMMETADILKRASEKSMVIMDEVGRGTTVNDGLAISFATLHHLATVNKSRCFFATHFHDLAEMVGNKDGIRGSGVFEKVRFYCSDIDEAEDGYFTYAYRLRPGVNRDSHGLKVARMAGVPPAAMTVASDTLAWLTDRDTKKTDTIEDTFARYTIQSTD